MKKSIVDIEKQFIDMSDYDNITAQLSELLSIHPDNDSALVWLAKYCPDDKFNYNNLPKSIYWGESLGKVSIKSGKQSVYTSNHVSFLANIITKRRKTRPSIEKPKLFRHSKKFNPKIFPFYIKGMSTHEYCAYWLWKNYKECPENAMSYFQPLNKQPAKEYDPSFPEVVLEIVS